MIKKDVKKILMSMRNIENEKQINNLLGQIDLLSEKEFQSLLAEVGNDEEDIRTHILNKLKEKPDIKYSKNMYYSNAEIDQRETRTFTQAKDALDKILKILEENNLKKYITGGMVPYILLNQDSNRLHDDIDTICNLDNIEKLRELFKKEGLYIPEWDSKTYARDGKDYGFEIKIDGVPFGIAPFEYKDGEIIQYSFDPYNKTCKTKIIHIKELDDYIYSYESKDGRVYNTMSLEYIKLTKDNTRRPKDITDSQKISEYGIREDVIERISMYKETSKERFE